MFICLCYGITDTQIRQAAENGVTDVRALKEQLGAGGQCGKCVRMSRDIIREVHESQTEYYEVA